MTESRVQFEKVLGRPLNALEQTIYHEAYCSGVKYAVERAQYIYRNFPGAPDGPQHP